MAFEGAPAEASSVVLSQSVYERIREGIISGRYAPGSQLKERDIAEELSVSRIPIRIALNRLEVSGFVRVLPRRSAVVTPITRRDVDELYDLRAALEPLVARTAAVRIADGADAAPLRRALADATAALERDDKVEFDRCNSRLHAVIEFTAAHELFDRTFAPLQDRSDRLSAVTIAAEPQVRHAEHVSLVGAVVAGEPELAAASAFLHAEQGRRRTLAALDGR